MVESGDMVLKLNKSLYRLKNSPLAWFKHLKKELEEKGFQAHAQEPCLFIKDNIICLGYVDDCLFFRKDMATIDELIKDLQNPQKKTLYALEEEADVSAFLGIKIKNNDDGTMTLSQPNLINKVLEACGMTDCHAKATPANVAPLGTDISGPPRRETWNYASVIGMLLYICANSRPDITFAVHQCAQFTHNPKQSHEEAVKRICRYLKGTADKGLIFTPNIDLGLTCYVDADFAGL